MTTEIDAQFEHEKRAQYYGDGYEDGFNAAKDAALRIIGRNVAGCTTPTAQLLMSQIEAIRSLGPDPQ